MQGNDALPGARTAIVIAAIAFVLTGCATNRAMMPTPCSAGECQAAFHRVADR
jgi:hypothetical protein